MLGRPVVISFTEAASGFLWQRLRCLQQGEGSGSLRAVVSKGFEDEWTEDESTVKLE